MPPIYDYECKDCKITEEKIVLSKEPEVVCPKCGTRMHKKVGGSGVGFRLYGEGFQKRSHKDTGDWGG